MELPSTAPSSVQVGDVPCAVPSVTTTSYWYEHDVAPMWMGLSERAVSHLVKRGNAFEQSDADYSTRLDRTLRQLGIDRAPF